MAQRYGDLRKRRNFAAGESENQDMNIALARRRVLRGRATEAERILWRLLRARRFLKLKFRRQHPVGPYIVDFYCARHRLAVELDGGQHFTLEGLAYDKRRTDYLAARSIRVLRFTNRELFENSDGVLETIHQAKLSRALDTMPPLG